MVDATLTAFLMMGNFSEGLKRLAVTLLEVGKVEGGLLLSELDALCDLAELGEVEVMFDQVWCLRDALKAVLQGAETAAAASEDHGGVPEDDAGSFQMDGRLDVVRSESLSSLGNPVLERMLSSQYAVLVSCTPLGEPFPTFRGGGGAAEGFPTASGPPATYMAEENALDGSPWAMLLAGLAAGVAPVGLVLPKRASLSEWPPFGPVSGEQGCNTGLIVWAWSAGAARGGDGMPSPTAVLPLGDTTLSGDAWESINRAALDDALLVQLVRLEDGSPVFRDEPIHEEPIREEPIRDEIIRNDVLGDLIDLGDPTGGVQETFVGGGAEEEGQNGRGEDSAKKVAARAALNLGLGRSLGFVRLVAVPGAGGWAPVGAHLGMPMFDPDLVAAVGQGAAACLAPRALHAHASALSALSARLERDLLAPHGTLASPSSPAGPTAQGGGSHRGIQGGHLLPRHRLLVATDGSLSRQTYVTSARE